MKTTYTVRVILDCEDDVIRDIEIDAAAYLDDLDKAIKEAFKLEGNEMSAFYKSDDDWEQGEEINVMEFQGSKIQDHQLKDCFAFLEEKMLYVYDFLNLWTFYIELQKSLNTEANPIGVISSIGERPEQDPENDLMDIEEVLPQSDEEDDLFDDVNPNDLSDFY